VVHEYFFSFLNHTGIFFFVEVISNMIFTSKNLVIRLMFRFSELHCQGKNILYSEKMMSLPAYQARSIFKVLPMN
jgi:hypothetical protein